MVRASSSSVLSSLRCYDLQHAAASQVDLWAAICVGIYCNNIKLKRNMIKKLVKTQHSSGLGFESLPFD